MIRCKIKATTIRIYRLLCDDQYTSGSFECTHLQGKLEKEKEASLASLAWFPSASIQGPLTWFTLAPYKVL